MSEAELPDSVIRIPIYASPDISAGARSLRGPGGKVKRFWVGYNNLKAVDHHTGAVMATTMIPADVNESKAYPEFLNQIIENSGQLPRAVVGDRGFSLNEVYELNTKAGILTATPWRKHKPNEDRDIVGTDYYDQHGVPLCQKCGGPGRQTRFQAGEKPRIWFQCENGCGEGSVVCSKGWRYLLPVSRESETYLALRHSHSHYEKAHWRWRDQWLVGPDNPSNRPRRRGIGCQELRAQAALLIEWLLVCCREGWLGGPRINQNRKYESRAIKTLRRFLRHRVNEGLHLNNAKRQKHNAEILKKSQKRNE